MAPINILPTEPLNLTGLNEYQEVSSSTAVYPGQGTDMGLIYCTLKLNGEAGECAEKVGKSMRDNWDKDQRDAYLILELGDVLWYVAAAAREIGVTLEDVANANVRKLQSRQARGVLQGSGDMR